MSTEKIMIGNTHISRKRQKEMIRIIMNWTGHFDIEQDKSDQLFYAVIGYAARKVPVYIGPADNREALIQMGYTKLYNQMWILTRV